MAETRAPAWRRPKEAADGKAVGHVGICPSGKAIASAWDRQGGRGQRNRGAPGFPSGPAAQAGYWPVFFCTWSYAGTSRHVFFLGFRLPNLPLLFSSCSVHYDTLGWGRVGGRGGLGRGGASGSAHASLGPLGGNRNLKSFRAPGNRRQKIFLNRSGGGQAQKKKKKKNFGGFSARAEAGN